VPARPRTIKGDSNIITGAVVHRSRNNKYEREHRPMATSLTDANLEVLGSS
jgi:hypothetical protein